MVPRFLTKELCRIVSAVAVSALLSMVVGCPAPGTCHNPAAGTVCTTACSRLQSCFSCCAGKHGARGPNNPARDVCDRACEAKFVPESPPPCGCVCDGPEPDPSCPDAAFQQIFANSPAFMNTPAMQGFVCSLTAAERLQLRDDVLANQDELWGVDEDQYAEFIAWLDQEVWDMLMDYDIADDDTGCYEVFFNALLYQYWLDYTNP